jgi:hypothetical protein
MTTYALDADLARKSDESKTRIDASGEYVGHFTKAKKVISTTGTEGIEFSFETNEGATGDYMTLYTIKADGTKIFGFGLLMALMTCLKVRQIGTQKIAVDEWDNIARAVIPVEAEHFTELMNKPIGVLIQREPIIDQFSGDVKIDKNGFPKWKLNLTGFFDPVTRKTAGEILDKAETPARLERKLSSLRDKPLPTQSQQPVTQPMQSQPLLKRHLPPLDDDDIPF